jgi:hypothetical protein
MGVDFWVCSRGVRESIWGVRDSSGVCVSQPGVCGNDPGVCLFYPEKVEHFDAMCSRPAVYCLGCAQKKWST